MAVAALAGFLAQEATARNPLIPLPVFRSREIAAANIVQALLTAGMFGFFFLGALDLRLVLGYRPLQIGLAFLPLTALVAVVSLRYAGRLIARHGPARTLLPGLALVAAGLFLFAHAPADGGYLPSVLPVMAVLGAGVGLAFPAVMALAMSQATERGARNVLFTGMLTDGDKADMLARADLFALPSRGEGFSMAALA